VIVALIQGSDVLAVNNFTFALLTVGIYFIIQQFENNLLVPRIIGNSVNLHPVVVICGVVVGASVGGILGAFLAAPVIASLRMLGSYVYNKLIDNPVALEPLPVRADDAFYRRVVLGDEVVIPAGETSPAQVEAQGDATASAPDESGDRLADHHNGTGRDRLQSFPLAILDGPMRRADSSPHDNDDRDDSAMDPPEDSADIVSQT